MSISLASLMESRPFLKSITAHFQIHIQFNNAKLNKRFCFYLCLVYFDEDVPDGAVYFCQAMELYIFVRKYLKIKTCRYAYNK